VIGIPRTSSLHPRIYLHTRKNGSRTKPPAAMRHPLKANWKEA